MATIEKRETINDVVLQGRIVHKFSAPKVTILTLATRNANSVSNYPKVVCFEELKNEADKFEKGDYVEVKGNIQSSKRNPEIKNQVLISIFAESVKEAKSVMEKTFAVEGNYIPQVNEFRLSGTVVSVDNPAGNILNVTVRTDKNNRPSFVKLTRFLKGGSDPVIDVRPGDFVYILGHVQTHRSDARDETKYFQNYVISELKK